ncbi:basal-body rod modification protein FlgD [Geomonas silvestris]|uniref:Basal-body rod modification protein FlgD n=1 Tax=Geomonas silvestris TaxID=2740184 RepID=A0A6V8MFY8_9BACT|nr:flagellar hook capping FlgD N-terminal domain-containing protein [Geomonas silvestris]GFO58589.1 basal-body rod modification protein FlgD [Geomonas silvestris]
MISNVTSTAATGSSTGAEAMKQATGMNKDDFLKLFVTQLQNQDPLNPQDSSQFITQLSQITQVEQAYNTNTNLQSLLNQGGNSMTMASVSMIGKQVQASGSQVSLSSGSPSSVNFNLGQAADQVTVSILNGSGSVIKTIHGGAMSAGDGSLNWDGTDNLGNQVASGAYSFSVAASDATGNKVTTTPLIKGKVDGVDMSGATPVLSIGNVKVSLTDVTAVSSGG